MVGCPLAGSGSSLSEIVTRPRRSPQSCPAWQGEDDDDPSVGSRPSVASSSRTDRVRRIAEVWTIAAASHLRRRSHLSLPVADPALAGTPAGNHLHKATGSA